jgi:type II secretory pathway component HofQ
MFKRLLILIALIPSVAFCYTVVRKDGKKFTGDLVRESAEEVLLKDEDGITIRFKKDQIDWDKTTAERQKEEKKEIAKTPDKTIEIRRVEQKKEWTGDPISIDFKDVDIRDLFRFLAETGKMNLIVDPEVKGTVTIKMTDVPWDQVLDAVCKMHNLGYTIEGNVVSIDK